MAAFRHVLRCRGILDTPPLRTRPANLVFCSMASHSDLVPYLVAAKSVYRQFGEGRFVLVDDGSMTARDHSLLKQHLVDIEIVSIRGVSTGKAPRGGCWERLITVLDRCRDAYVIQVDSDTLTLGAVPELIDCYRRNLSFTLAGEEGATICPMPEAAASAKAIGGSHMQVVCETALERFKDAPRRNYVRGCAGFTGFARGALGPADAEAFSEEASGVIGGRWNEWGSEQITSNYLIANTPGAIVLPYDKYANYQGAANIDAGLSFLHFVGTWRYVNEQYSRLSREVIANLRAAG